MRYGLVFLLAVLLLTTVAVGTFTHLSAPNAADSVAALPPADTVEPPAVRTPLHPTAADFARFEREDRAWRAAYAKQYSLAELRARGDGHRSPREQMQDRVFKLTRSGRSDLAIAELERWVSAQPRDADALLSLARLLNETGRTDSSIARYRQVMALRYAGR
jgi:cytochrome c-type biogenesis protein CcmH/NrfG